MNPNFLLFIGLVHGSLVKLPPGKNDDDQARLYIGGSEVANIEDTPSTIALLTSRGDKLNVICTGSIISVNWVLTAAHCVFLSPSLLWIAAGSNSTYEIDKAFNNLGANLNGTTANGRVQLRRVTQIVKHPRYTDVYLFAGRFDVALCKVDSWSFGVTVNQIDLWNETWNGEKDPDEEYRFQKCVSFGWGTTQDKDVSASPYLRTSVFKIQHGSRACSCLKPYINRRLLCTGSKEKEHSACPGDSGGPLVCQNKLAGVAHVLYLGRRCLFEPLFGRYSDYRVSPMQSAVKGFCGRANVVSAWMYVCPVLGWIKQYVQDAPKPPLSCRSAPLLAISPFIITAITVGSAAYT